MVADSSDHLAGFWNSLRETGFSGSVQLLDRDKRLLLRRQSPGADRRKEERAGKALTLDFPLRFKPSCARCHEERTPVLGYIRTVSPIGLDEAAVKRHRWQHLAAAVGSVLVLGLLSFSIARSLVQKPLDRVVDGMEGVSAGNLDTRLSGPFPQELARISAAFNGMVDNLARGKREIEELHRRQVAHMDRLVSAGELAAKLAHEVRNPLTGIGSAIQVLRRGVSEDDERHGILTKMLGQVERMNRSLTNYLEFARMPKPATRLFGIQEPLENALFLIDSRARGAGIKLVRDIPKRLLGLKGDPAQMEQVFLNICLNAVEAMPSGGELRVTAKSAGPSDVRLEFHDTGAGIPEEDLPRVLQPFYTTRKDGSGLGLAMAHQIVATHGGELWIESVPGEGTSVFIRLPGSERPLND